MSGLLLGIVLSVCTCWFRNMVTLPPWLVSIDFGTSSYQCFLSNCTPVSLHTLKCSCSHTLSCIIIISSITLVPLSRRINERIDHHHHHHHHHVAQNNFIQAVLWGISNVSDVIAWVTSFVLGGWWVQAFRKYTVPPAITFRRRRQFVRNVFLYIRNYTVSFPGRSDYEPSLSWKPLVSRYRVCHGCKLPVVGPMCKLECTFLNQLPR